MDTMMFLPVGAFLVMVILYLNFRLWLAERDARTLRKVTFEAEPADRGCLLVLLAILVLLVVAAYIAFTGGF